MPSQTESEKAIAIGFPHWDRYVRADCERSEHARTLALRYEARVQGRQLYHPTPWVKDLLVRRVLDLYREMPIEIEVCAHEPYLDADAMFRDIRDHQRMFVRSRRQGPVVGSVMQCWRAVHDYYGHYQALAPFTFSGELLAYAKHAAQFPLPLLPFIWNNVVLENTYRLVRGHFLCLSHQCGSTIVFDDEYFGCSAVAWDRKMRGRWL